MKYISKPISKAAIAIMALAAVALTVLLVSCSKGGSSAKPDNVDYYTCTMHPSVKSQDPKAKCPICSMDLVPVMKKNVGASERESVQASHAPDAPRSDAPSEFTVPVERQQLIGVTYAEIRKKPFTHTVRAVGTVAYDKQRHWDYVTRVEGYVESAAGGLLTAYFVAARLRGEDPVLPPPTTALGGILTHLGRSPDDYQPSNITWAHFPPFTDRRLKKRDRYEAMAERALRDLDAWLAALRSESLPT